MQPLKRSDPEWRIRAEPPIATCHWPLLAKALKQRVHREYGERLGLAWGCRFKQPGVLFGAMTWPQVFTDVCGAVITIETFDDPACARSRELDLTAAGCPFVAEVDEYYLPGYITDRHAVHAILVIERTNYLVRFIDARLSDTAETVTADEFDAMRSTPCDGRVEPMKLYAITRDPNREPSSAALLSAVRNYHRRHHAQSLAALHSFMEWARDASGPIDVCRPAGERYQSTILFQHLATHGVTQAAPIRDRLRRLTEDWYLVHMLGTHDECLKGRRRARVIRLLSQLIESERRTSALVLQ